MPVASKRMILVDNFRRRSILPILPIPIPRVSASALHKVTSLLERNIVLNAGAGSIDRSLWCQRTTATSHVLETTIRSAVVMVSTVVGHFCPPLATLPAGTATRQILLVPMSILALSASEVLAAIPRAVAHAL